MADEFTLADFERTAPDNLTKAVVRTWREASPILDMLKFRTSKNLSEKIIRLNEVGSPTWRLIGESFTQMKVNTEPIEERLHFMGAKIDIPVEYVKAESIVDVRALQSEAAMKSVAFGFNDAFFTGDPISDPKALVGVHYRIKNDLGSGQYFDTDLDVSKDVAVTAALINQMFDAIDQLLELVDGPDSEKSLWMGTTLYRRVQSYCRQSNLLASTKDQLGRRFSTYGEGGPLIMDAGKEYDQSTNILTDVNDDLTLTGGAKSCMYCLRFGAPAIEGWCQEMPNAQDKGELEDGVNMRTIVRFSPGLFMTSPRSAALAYGWTAA